MNIITEGVVWLFDGGHGGKDSGAVGLGGIKEKHMNLVVALECQRIMQYNGEKAFVTRKTDKFLEITNRRKVAEALIKSQKAKVIYAAYIHHNAGGGDGSEVIYEIDSPISKAWATLVEKEFEVNGQKAHGAKPVYAKADSTGHEDYFGVLRSNNMVHSIIPEGAFVDTADVKDFDTIEELCKEAEAICRANMKLIGKTYKQPPTRGTYNIKLTAA